MVLIIHVTLCPVPMISSAQIYLDGTPLLIQTRTSIWIFVLSWYQRVEETVKTIVKDKDSNASMLKTIRAVIVHLMVLMTDKLWKVMGVYRHGVTKFVLVENLNQKNLGTMSHGHSIHLLSTL
jgi:hypothetical protein